MRLVPRDESEDHAIERAVRLLEEERGLLRCEPSPARDVRDLGHEPRAEEEERLSALAEREPVPARLDPVLATEHLGLRDELIASSRAGGVEVSEEQIAHADAALAEPAERVLIEPRIPVLLGEVDAHALAELGRDTIRSFTQCGERLPARLPRAGQHRVDRRAQESAVPAGRGEDLDLSGIGPSPQRVGIDAEDPARFPQRQPVTALERARFGDTANLGESAAGRQAMWMVSQRELGAMI